MSNHVVFNRESAGDVHSRIARQDNYENYGKLFFGQKQSGFFGEGVVCVCVCKSYVGDNLKWVSTGASLTIAVFEW